MYVTRVPNRNSPPAVLLRESYRDGNKVKTRTLANLSSWSDEKVNALKSVLIGEVPKVDLLGSFEITRSLPHGAVAAVLGTLRSLGLEEMIDKEPSRNRDLVVAMITSQIIDPTSKFGISRGLRTETASSSLGEVLCLSRSDEDDLYSAMDYLFSRQEKIEYELAKKHLNDGVLLLYDVSSAAFETKTCPLGKIGHAKDGVHGRLQIVYGQLTTKEGIPVAIEVFSGNTADPKTVLTTVKKIKERFCLNNVCIVGDRGMLTKARIEEDVSPEDLNFITALRAPQIKSLIKEGFIQPSLFDNMDMAEIQHPDFLSQRLVVCKNPLLAKERGIKREELLIATEKELEKIKQQTTRERRKLKGKDKIAIKVGKVINHYRMEKHFIIEISEDSFSYSRNLETITAEKELDGFYVIRTDLNKEVASTAEVVSGYKALSNVERVFRNFNTDLDIRPIRHHTENRVKAHVFLRMLSCYVSWHMNERLKTMLFKDDDTEKAEELRSSPVAPAKRSESALKKVQTKRTVDKDPVHSFETLLRDLSTITANQIQPTDLDCKPFTMITVPTKLQAKAFKLLGVSHRLGYM